MSNFRRWRRSAEPLSQFSSAHMYLLTNLGDNAWLGEPEQALSTDPRIALLHDFYHFQQFIDGSLGHFNRNPPVYGLHWRYAGRFIPIARDMGCTALARRLAQVMAHMQKIPLHHVEAYINHDGIETVPVKTRKRLDDLLDGVGQEKYVVACASPKHPRTKTGSSIHNALAARVEALRAGRSKARPAPLSPELHRFLLAQTALLEFEHQHGRTGVA